MEILMEPELDRIETVFQKAADLPAGERAAFLAKACAGEPGVQRRVEAMLAELERGESLGAAALDDVDLPEGPGTIIGRYKLLQKIGEGGFGVVYMAEQQEPVVRRVALKIIKLGMDTREVIARFEAERQALALMDHPNIARVLDGGATESGRPYFVMELVRGVSITEYCDSNSLSTRDRIDLFVRVCHAVQHAHQKGVIHRDLKPSNVMVTLHDGKPVPMVIDFGVAKAMHTRLTEKTLFTAYERFIGTPAYMSPEQAELSGLDVDTRTDVYALGVLLYELLTGSTPFDARELIEEGLAAIQRKIREVPPERPSIRVSTSADATIAQQRQADVPALSRLIRGDLDWIVMKCLEKERERRYETASGLAADLDRHLRDEPVEAGPPSAVYRLRKLVARNRAAVLSVTVLLLGLVLGLVGLTLGLMKARREQAQALLAMAMARQEALRAETVTDFLVDTLALADPEVVLDPDLSVASLLHRASAQAGEALQQQPEAEGRVRVTIGRAYKALGQNELAEINLRRGIELLRQAQGTDPVELYTAMWDLTNVLFNLERDDAMAVAQEARRVAHDHLRASHPETAEVLDRLVDRVNAAAFSMSVEAGADLPALFEESVRATDAALPPGDPLWPMVADTWVSSGYSVWYGPNDPLSIQFFGRAQEILRRELPPDHPYAAEVTGLYANALYRNGRAADAEEAMRDSVERMRAVLPPESPRLAFAESTLGANLVSQGRYEEAEPYLLRGHAVIAATVDESTRFPLADSLGRLLDLYDGWGRPDAAAPYRAELREVCARSDILMPHELAVRAIGPEHAVFVEHLERLDELCGGVHYGVEPRAAAAAGVGEVLDDVLRMRAEGFDDDDPVSILVSRELLGLASGVQPGTAGGAHRRMVEEGLRGLSPFRERFPAEMARGHALLADYQAEDGDPASAVRNAKEAWRLARELSPGNWVYCNIQVRVARTLVALELFDEAESLLVPAHQNLVEQFGPDNPDVTVASELLFETYTAWGRYEEARAFSAPAHDSE